MSTFLIIFCTIVNFAILSRSSRSVVFNLVMLLIAVGLSVVANGIAFALTGATPCQ